MIISRKVQEIVMYVLKKKKKEIAYLIEISFVKFIFSVLRQSFQLPRSGAREVFLMDSFPCRFRFIHYCVELPALDSPPDWVHRSARHYSSTRANRRSIEGTDSRRQRRGREGAAIGCL